MIPLSTFYKPMIKVQMHLCITDGTIPSCLCYFLVSISKWYVIYKSFGSGFISGKLPMTEDEGCILCGTHRSRHGSYDIYHDL